MPSLNTTIDLIFKGQNELGPTINDVLRDVDKLNRSFQSIAGPISTVTQSILLLNAGLAVLAVNFAGDAFNAANEFSSAQAELAKVLGDTEGDVSDYNDEIFRLSNTYAESATNVISSIAGWKQAGFEAYEAGLLAEQAIRLMVAGDLEAEEATKNLIKIIKGYGIEVADVAAKLDIINEITNKYGVNASQLSDGLSRLAPIAENLGISYEDLAGYLTPVIERTQSAEIAARGLRGLFLNLANPTAAISDEMQRLGISFTESDGALKSVNDILQELAPRFNTLTGAQKTQTVAILAGKESAAQASILLKEFGNAAEATAKGLAGVGTSIEKEVTTRLDGVAFKTEKASIAFNNLQISIGQQFQTELAGVFSGFSNLAIKLQELTDAGKLDGLFAELNPQLIALEKIFNDIAAALPEALANTDFSAFGAGIRALIGDLEGVEISADDVTESIESVANAFKSAAEFTRAVIDVFAGIADVLGPLVGGLTSLDSETLQIIGSIGAAAVVFKTLNGVITTTLGVLGKVGPALAGTSAATTALKTIDVAALGTANSLGKLGTVIGGLGFGLLAYELGRAIDLNDKLALDLVAGYDDATVGSVIADIAESFGLFGDNVQKAESTITKADIEMRKFVDGINKVEQPTKAAAEAFAGFAVDIHSVDLALQDSNIKGVAVDIHDLGEAANNAMMQDFAIDIHDTDESLRKMQQSVEGVVVTMVDGVTTFNQASDAITVIADSSETAEQKAARLDRQLVELVEKSGLAGIAFNELSDDLKKAVLEAKVEIDIAKLEAETDQLEIKLDALTEIRAIEIKLDIAKVNADVDRVKSAFNSINTSIQSTGDTLSSIIGQFSGAENFREELRIDSFAREELELRKKAFELQEQLTRAEIRQIDARTQQMLKDAPPITIDASGLGPAAEAFIYEIVGMLKIKLSNEERDFLRGVAA